MFLPFYNYITGWKVFILKHNIIGCSSASLYSSIEQSTFCNNIGHDQNDLYVIKAWMNIDDRVKIYTTASELEDIQCLNMYNDFRI